MIHSGGDGRWRSDSTGGSPGAEHRGAVVTYFDGLAAAAGLAVGPVLSIGESGPSPSVRFEEVTYSAMLSCASADDLEAELGELRPEPETWSDAVTVRVALVAAQGA